MLSRTQTCRCSELLFDFGACLLVLMGISFTLGCGSGDSGGNTPVPEVQPTNPVPVSGGISSEPVNIGK